MLNRRVFGLLVENRACATAAAASSSDSPTRGSGRTRCSGTPTREAEEEEEERTAGEGAPQVVRNSCPNLPGITPELPHLLVWWRTFLNGFLTKMLLAKIGNLCKTGCAPLQHAGVSPETEVFLQDNPDAALPVVGGPLTAGGGGAD